MISIADPTISLKFKNVTSIERISGNDSQIDFDDFTCCFLKGVFLSTSRFITGSFEASQNITPNEAADAIGEFTAIFKSKFNDSFIVMKDNFGFETHFYSLSDDNGLIIGNNLSSISYERNVLGEKDDVDWGNVEFNLSTDYSWTSIINSDSTPNAEIKSTRPFEFIYINENKSYILPINLLTEISVNSSYEDLLQFGIRSASKQLKILAETSDAQLRINLSGGKDSRIMMAMLSSAGIAKKYSVRSVNPRTWTDTAARRGLHQDLIIANTLRKHFGMAWDKEPDFFYCPINFQEAIDHWRVFRSGKNFRLALPQEIRVRNQQIIELRGASGETFRSFWSYYLSKILDLSSLKSTPECFKSDARLIFDKITKDNGVGVKVSDQGFHNFINSLEATGKETAAEAAEQHFTLYRNRGHFGTSHHFQLERALPIFPLNQYAFFLAGQKISPTERIHGSVQFDIIERLDPSLNDLEFDSNQWDPSVLDRKLSSKVTSWKVSDSEDDLKEFYDNDLDFNNRVVKARRDYSRTSPSYMVRPAIIAASWDIIDSISSVPGSSNVFTEQFSSLLKERLNFSSNRLLMTQLGKLLYIRDSFQGRSAAHRISFPESPIKNTLDGIGPGVQAPNIVFPNPVGGTQFFISHKITEENIVVTIHVTANNRSDLAYACYLKDGNKIVSQKFYQDGNIFVFDIQKFDTIQCFVKSDLIPKNIWSQKINVSVNQ